MVALATPAPAIDPPDPEDPALRPLDVQVAFEVARLARSSGGARRSATPTTACTSRAASPASAIPLGPRRHRLRRRGPLPVARRRRPRRRSARCPTASALRRRPLAPRQSASTRTSRRGGLDAPRTRRASTSARRGRARACGSRSRRASPPPGEPGTCDCAPGGALVGGADDGVSGCRCAARWRREPRPLGPPRARRCSRRLPPPRAAAPPPPPPAPARVYARGESFGTNDRPPASPAAADAFARSLRAEVRGGDVGSPSPTTAAAEPFADAVEVAGGRWAFFSYGGAVTVSDGYRRAPPARPRARGAVTNPGRGDARRPVRGGRLWLTDGASLAEAQVPRPVVAAAFASESAGAVVHRDGSLSATDDGGRTWRAVDLRGGSRWRSSSTETPPGRHHRGPDEPLRRALSRPRPTATTTRPSAPPPSTAPAWPGLRERRARRTVPRSRSPPARAWSWTTVHPTWRPPPGEAAVGRVGDSTCDAPRAVGRVRGPVRLAAPAATRAGGSSASSSPRRATRRPSSPTTASTRRATAPAPRARPLTFTGRSASAPSRRGADGASQPSACVLDDGRGRWRTVPPPRWRSPGGAGRSPGCTARSSSPAWATTTRGGRCSTHRPGGRDVRAEPDVHPLARVAARRVARRRGAPGDAPRDAARPRCCGARPTRRCTRRRSPRGDGGGLRRRNAASPAAPRSAAADDGRRRDVGRGAGARRPARRASPPSRRPSCDAGGARWAADSNVAGWARDARRRGARRRGRRRPRRCPTRVRNGASLELAPMTCMPARTTTPSPWRLPGDGPARSTATGRGPSRAKATDEPAPAGPACAGAARPCSPSTCPRTTDSSGSGPRRGRALLCPRGHGRALPAAGGSCDARGPAPPGRRRGAACA